MENRVRFISETFFPLSCLSTVSSDAAVSAPSALMHNATQHRHAINRIVFFKLSPKIDAVEFYPYKDSDERLECIFYFRRCELCSQISKQVNFSIKKRNIFAGWHFDYFFNLQNGRFLLANCSDDPVNLCGLVICILETCRNQFTSQTIVEIGVSSSVFHVPFLQPLCLDHRRSHKNHPSLEEPVYLFLEELVREKVKYAFCVSAIL